jgi:hypothetical protein
VLCCAVLCCAAQCCAVLGCAVLLVMFMSKGLQQDQQCPRLHELVTNIKKIFYGPCCPAGAAL